MMFKYELYRAHYIIKIKKCQLDIKLLERIFKMSNTLIELKDLHVNAGEKRDFKRNKS